MFQFWRYIKYNFDLILNRISQNDRVSKFPVSDETVLK